MATPIRISRAWQEAITSGCDDYDRQSTPQSYIPHVPTEKQAEFLALPHQEAFYGGAAIGGKSDALLMGALKNVHVPGYSALLFRRTYADLTLPGALMDRAREWLGPTDAKWNDREKTWRFPSGATLSFGYLDTVDDRLRYASAEFQFIGFDELTQFVERDYLFLFSRLRRVKGSTVPLRMRSASNPGGPGHDWVKARFVDPGDPGRPFISARVADNPHIDQDEYAETLGNLDHITRRQLLEGDWTARAGGSLFRREWFLPPVEAVPAHAKRVRYWDLASTEKTVGNDPDWTVGALLSRTSDGVFTIEDVARVQARPEAVESLVVGQASMDGPAVTIRIEQEPGASGKAMIAHYVKMFAGYNVAGDRPSGDKRTRAAPVSAQAEAGNVKMKRAHWNAALLDELDGFDGSGETGHDDQVDALSGALNALTIMARVGWSDLW